MLLHFCEMLLILYTRAGVLMHAGDLLVESKFVGIVYNALPSSFKDEGV